MADSPGIDRLGTIDQLSLGRAVSVKYKAADERLR
jgi:hypothetical protein